MMMAAGIAFATEWILVIVVIIAVAAVRLCSGLPTPVVTIPTTTSTTTTIAFAIDFAGGGGGGGCSSSVSDVDEESAAQNEHLAHSQRWQCTDHLRARQLRSQPDAAVVQPSMRMRRRWR